MINESLIPEDNHILNKALQSHDVVWRVCLESVTLAHLAFSRQQQYNASIVPGVDGISRARTDINDIIWRYFRSTGAPLEDQGYIREFKNIDGGEFAILSDGLHVRLKKGDKNGNTSNYPTKAIVNKRNTVQKYLFPHASALDKYILDGCGIDVVYISGNSMSEFLSAGLRLANARQSPFLMFDDQATDTIAQLCPESQKLIDDWKTKLVA